MTPVTFTIKATSPEEHDRVLSDVVESMDQVPDETHCTPILYPHGVMHVTTLIWWQSKLDAVPMRKALQRYRASLDESGTS